MTNNPRKVKALSEAGVNVIERVAIEVGRNPHNDGFLNTKASKLGHYLNNNGVNGIAAVGTVNLEGAQTATISHQDDDA
jgi:GTP cyclohydrolase II